MFNILLFYYCEVLKISHRCRLLSLDTSSSKTGWACYENATYKKSGVIDFDTKELKKKYQGDSERRLEDMCLAIINLLKEYEPDIIVIEKLNVGRNMVAVRHLAKVIGVVYCYAILNDCFYYEIQPSQWRSQIGIQSIKKDRKQLKQEAIEYVKNNLGINVTDDEADSICAGIAYIKIFS